MEFVILCQLARYNYDQRKQSRYVVPLSDTVYTTEQHTPELPMPTEISGILEPKLNEHSTLI